MRVLFYCNWYVKQTITLANGLSGRHEVAVVIPRPTCGAAPSDGVVRPAELKGLVDRRVRVLQLPFMQGFTPLGTLPVLRTWWFARRFAPDVVHLQESYDFRGLLLRLMLGRPAFAITVHDPVSHAGERISLQSFKHMVRDQTRARVDGLIVLGESLRKLLLDAGESPDRVFVAPHGPLPGFRELAREAEPRPNGKQRVVFFGRWEAYKGLDVLVAAAPRIWARFPSASVVLAGEGRLSLGALLPDLQERQRFEIRNYSLPDEEVAELYQGADVIVLPYREATQSGPLHIAADFGKAVVATAVGALGETVRHGETGLLVPPGDPAALADAVCALLADPAEAARLGRNAQALLSGDRALEELGLRYTAVYETIVARVAGGRH